MRIRYVFHMQFNERTDITDFFTEYAFLPCALDISSITILLFVLYWLDKNKNKDLLCSYLEQLL